MTVCASSTVKPVSCRRRRHRACSRRSSRRTAADHDDGDRDDDAHGPPRCAESSRDRSARRACPVSSSGRRRSRGRFAGSGKIRLESPGYALARGTRTPMHDAFAALARRRHRDPDARADGRSDAGDPGPVRLRGDRAVVAVAVVAAHLRHDAPHPSRPATAPRSAPSWMPRQQAASGRGRRRPRSTIRTSTRDAGPADALTRQAGTPSDGDSGCSAISRHAVQWHRNASTVHTWKISWKPKWPGHGFGRFSA